MVGSVVDGRAYNRAGGELDLVDGKNNAAEVSGSNFVDVDLGEGEEPADRNA